MSKSFFSGRIPISLAKAVEKYSQETGLTKTAILINALQQYLGYEVENPQKEYLSKIEQLSNEIEALKIVVEQHEEIIKILKLNLILEKKTISHKPTQNVSTPLLTLLQFDNDIVSKE